MSKHHQVSVHFENTFVFKNLLKDDGASEILAAIMVSLPAPVVPLPVNRFPNKLVPYAPTNILRNLLLCFFPSFSIVSLTHFINELEFQETYLFS